MGARLMIHKSLNIDNGHDYDLMPLSLSLMLRMR
jgi:hypothetical protein